ncbi:MAG: hypothetical protein H8D23_30730 [Candidatus Brocadiales bacterium]|nr:hypothetical protein [Candidatus Brocadiales bacterium]
MINKNKPFYSNKLFQIPLIFLLIVFMYMPKTFSGFIVSNHCTWDLDHIIEFDVADTICADGQINTYYGFPNFQYFADVFIVPNRVWSHNDILIDITSDNRVIGDLGGGSFLGATIGLPGGTPRGEYDLILDDNANGRFDLGYDSIIGQGTDFAFRVVESGRPIPDVSGIKTRAAGLETSYGAAATAWPLYLDLLDLQSQASAFASGPIGIMEYYLWKPYNDMTGDFARKIMGSYGPNPTPPPQRLAFGILGNAAKKWGDLARDPADPVFDEFVALDLQGIASETVGFGAPYTYPFAPIGPSQREADMVAWGNLGVQQVALVKALQRTIEKYQGADQAFDDTYAYLQVRQLKEYANMLKVNMTGSILSANQIKANIIAEGDDDVLDVSALASFQQRVINSGLTPEEEGNILALGFDAADILITKRN